MTTTGPIDPADRLVLERLMNDERVRAWLVAQLPPRPVRAFMMDKDTWRILLTAVAIPLFGWLALKGYAAADAIYHRDQHIKAAEEARATRQQADTRSDVERVSALMPYLGGTPAQQAWSQPALRALADASNRSDNLFSRRMFASMTAQARTASASPVATIRDNGVKTLELLSPTAPPAPATAPGAPQGGVAPAVTSLPAVPPSLVYIQNYGDAQAAVAQNLAEAFRKAGIPVPGIEDVTRAHPDTAFSLPQRGAAAIRYYREADQGAARFAATIVARILGGAPPQLRYLHIATQRSGIVEVWLPCQLDACRQSAANS